MSDTTILEQHLERDTEALRERLRKMADMVLGQLEDAVSAFSESNRQLAYRVVLKDHRIDVLEAAIDRMCQEYLIRHMPVARHLRFVVAVAKVNAELERIGDYAEAIARRAVTLSKHDEVPEKERTYQMSRVAFKMLRNAITAFINGDPEGAMRTLEDDQQVNEMQSALFEALAHPPEGMTDLTGRFAHLGLVNRIERVADRACNIAEETVYVERGEVLRHLPRFDMRVLFLCDHNSCRSQMAEGLARSVAPAHFIFSSAGAEPQALDKDAVAFMASKGIDISRQRSKGLDAVGPIEDYHIVVTLTEQADEVCPKVPYKAVKLVWNIPDPNREENTYEQVYELLEEKITEMTEGLIGAFEREDDE